METPLELQFEAANLLQLEQDFHEHGEQVRWHKLPASEMKSPPCTAAGIG